MHTASQTNTASIGNGVFPPFESECVSGGQETGEFGTENRGNAHCLSLFSLFEVALDEEAGHHELYWRDIVNCVLHYKDEVSAIQ